jgi:glycerol-3-phosphate acyltransferase PlsX
VADDSPPPAGSQQPTGSQPPTIAVDAMGGDHAPAEVVGGAITATASRGMSIVLTGRPSQLRPLLGTRPPGSDIRVVPAEDSIAMDEGALASRRRPRSSVAVACQLVRRGEAAAVVSAGSTAAIVAIARLRLRSLPGLMRPGLAVVLPTAPKPTLLVDAGAIADPKPEMLLQFAQLGVAYAQVAFGVEDPRVGLLTIGTEPVKGNKLARRAHELLTTPPHGGLPIRFTGNIEGSDLMAGEVDVVVTDGFTGNVALKTIEGAGLFATQQVRAALQSSRTARFGALFQRQALRELAGRMDAETYGGGALLGLEGTVVIAHGSSTAKGIASACQLAADLARGHITEKIRERLGPGHRSGYFLRRP